MMSKKNTDQATLDKISSGKKTMKMFFKSSTRESELENKNLSIANVFTCFNTQCERDFENFEEILKILNVYLAEQAIISFKRHNVANYYRTMQRFAHAEISNSHLNATFWNKALKKLQNTMG